MAGTTVTQQSPVPLRRANQVQEIGDKDADKELVPEEAVIKDMLNEADASNVIHTHHQAVTSREKWSILARF